MADENKTEVQQQVEPKQVALACVDTGPLAVYFDSATFNQGWRAAKLLSETALVPQRYAGKPADCFVGIALARRLGMEPFAVLPDLYVVHGTPAMSGKLVIALINKSGLYKGSLKFRFDSAKPPAWCEAYAIERETGEEVRVRISWDDVVANGWNRDGSKWKSMREQMFRYRAAAWFSRAYCPEVGFGLLTADEVEDDMSPEAKRARSQPVKVEVEAQTAAPPPPPVQDAEFAPRVEPEPPKRGRPKKDRAQAELPQRITPAEAAHLSGVISASANLGDMEEVPDFAARVLGRDVDSLLDIAPDEAAAVEKAAKGEA